MTHTQLIRELFKYLESSLIQLKSVLIELENSQIQLESALIEEVSNSIRELSVDVGKCTIRERTYSFAMICSALKSKSIKELSN